MNDSSLFAGDNEAISNDFVALLKEFFIEKPEFEAVPLYIFGQSYGGKMTVDIALRLYQVSKVRRKTNDLNPLPLTNIIFLLMVCLTRQLKKYLLKKVLFSNGHNGIVHSKINVNIISYKKGFIILEIN